MKVESEVLPDAVISHYRVVTKLGAGGMGEVWVGVDETLRRKVAMKAIRKDRRLDQHAKARFLREARILSQLDHPNICRVYDYIDSEHRDWLVLELIDGDTLRAAITSGMTPAQRLRVAIAIARVLVAMHAAGVVHRDLKPTNVMLTPSGESKVLDFGLSAVDSQPEETAREYVQMESGEASGPIDLGATQFNSIPGSVMGTLAYMSPEQLRGEQATTASDVFAFGIVLEEMYTAHAPQGAPPYPRDRAQPPTAPVAITDLIKRLLATAPSQRPTAVEALSTLERIADTPRRVRQRLLIAAVITFAILGAAKYTWDLARERTAAVAARDDADRRRQQAESLIGFMVGDLRTRLTAVGRLDLLDEVGKKSLEYFDAVPGSTLSGVELFRRSQTLHQLGQMRLARRDTAGATAAFDESLALARRVTASDPNNAEWQVGLGASVFYVGDMKRRRGDLEGALADFRVYQEIGRKLVERDPNNVEWKLELSYGHSNVAAILSGQRKYREARQELEQTRDIQAEIARIKPEDRTIQTSRANNLNRLGAVLQRLGEFDAAIASFEGELAIYEELRTKDPRNIQYQRRVPLSMQFIGTNQRALGRPEAAIQTFRRATDAARELAQHDPANLEWQQQYAFNQLYVGRMLIHEGRSAEALSLFQSSRAILAAIAAKNPGANDAARDFAQPLFNLADVYATQGRYADALRELEAAIKIFEERHKVDAAEAITVRSLAMALNLHGRIKEAQGDARTAAADWTRSVELLRPLQIEETDFTIIDPFVRALVFLGRHDEARVAVERLQAIGYREREFTNFWTEHAEKKTR